jgi:dTDP-4-dehydrorhamnose reductase
MKKILVTGSEGMLGKAIVKSLKSGGARVICTDIQSGENRLDITMPEQVSDFVERIKPDIIIHTAAYTDVDACEKFPEKAYAVNAKGVKNIAWAAKDTGAFLIYISTDYIFDGKKKAPYVEQDRPDPISVYGKSKLAGEDAVRGIIDGYLIIRTSWLFGKGGKNFVDTIIEKAKSGKALRVVDDQKGSPTYAADLAEAIKTLLLTAYNQQPATIMHITNSGACTWHEFAKEILRLKEIDGIEIESVSSYDMPMSAKRPAMSILDNSRYISLSGRALPPWQDALKCYLGEEK